MVCRTRRRGDAVETEAEVGTPSEYVTGAGVRAAAAAAVPTRGDESQIEDGIEQMVVVEVGVEAEVLDEVEAEAEAEADVGIETRIGVVNRREKRRHHFAHLAGVEADDIFDTLLRMMMRSLPSYTLGVNPACLTVRDFIVAGLNCIIL